VLRPSESARELSETRAFGSGVLAAAADLAPGTRLGDWRVVARIAAGGMGTVYAAVHEVIGKRAAIKVIRAEVCTSPAASDRLIQEARLVNEIDHPNIVDIFHVGRLDDGRPYLVMELLVGQTLGERLAEARLPPLEAIGLLGQVCAALEAAHRRGVVHRDLKPDNIILTEIAGAVVVKLVDWGIAKMKVPAGAAPSGPATLVGTPRYVAPEQARGRSVDERADIYSLGAIAYELFLETPPFSADNIADLLAAHLREPVPPPSELWPDIPVELEELLLRMLAKQPADRPSLAAVAAGLERVRVELVRRSGPLAGPGEVPPVRRALAIPTGGWSSPSQPGGRPLFATGELIEVPETRRHDFAVGALAVAAALVVAGLFGVSLQRRGPLVPDRVHRALAASEEPRRLAAPALATPSLLDVRVHPPAARVSLDGEVLEVAGGRVLRPLPAGVHEIEITAEGFAPYRRAVEIGPGALTLLVELEPAVARSPGRQPARPPVRAAARRRPPALDPDGTIDPFD
jgi:eukaryotic-like serine/threonine-protein kinase